MGALISAFDVEASVEDVWDLHRNPGVLRQITPPGIQVRMPEIVPEPRNEVRMMLHLHPLGLPWGIPWESIFSDVEPPRRFVDTQGRGPFASWWHEHRFEPLADGRTRIVETVRWTVPGGWVGRLLDPLLFLPGLWLMFLWRKLCFRRILRRKQP